MAKRRCQVLCGLPQRLPGRQLRAYGEGGYCVSMTMSNASHEGFSRFVAETGRSLQRYVRRLVGSPAAAEDRSEEHTSELQSLMRISYAVFCLKQKQQENKN